MGEYAMPKRRAVVVGAGLVVAALVGAAAPASAHSGGRVQLFVDRLALHPTGGNDWTVSLIMVDADSGTLAPGFDVAAEAIDSAGHSAGATPLADHGGGEYTGRLTAAPGKWEVAIRADTLPGGVVGVPLRKTYDVTLEPGKDVALGGRAPARRQGSGTGVALPLVAGAVLAVIAGWLLFGRHRRPAPAPARRQPLA
jgi:hypothetical protein